MSDDRILEDLTKHLNSRIHLALVDFADRCSTMGIEADVTMAAALGTLLRHFVSGTRASGISEQDTVGLLHTYMRREKQRNG